MLSWMKQNIFQIFAATVVSLMIAFGFIAYMIAIGVPKTQARNDYNRGILALEAGNEDVAIDYFEYALDHWDEKYIREMHRQTIIKSFESRYTNFINRNSSEVIDFEIEDFDSENSEGTTFIVTVQDTHNGGNEFSFEELAEATNLFPETGGQFLNLSNQYIFCGFTYTDERISMQENILRSELTFACTK